MPKLEKNSRYYAAMTTPLLIDRADTLAQFVARTLEAPWLGLDTEFVRDRHYFPRAGLIQIAAPGEIALVDPVRLSTLAPLEALLFETPATKTLHAAYQDLELLRHLFGRVPAPLFDTQEAAAAVGLAPQIGYAALARELIGAESGPALGRYDWLGRPLAERALDYAAEDVAHLGHMREILVPRLAAEGAAAEFSEAMRAAADPDRYRPDPERAWQRIRAARRLDTTALVRLKRLARWREQQAMREDRPRQWIVRDKTLVALARRAPRGAAELADVPFLRPAARRRYGRALLALVAVPEADIHFASKADGASASASRTGDSASRAEGSA